MSNDQSETTISYEYTPSLDGEERLARAYDLIINLMLSGIQCPEEDAVGAVPNVADAGAKLGSPQAEAVPAEC